MSVKFSFYMLKNFMHRYFLKTKSYIDVGDSEHLKTVPQVLGSIVISITVATAK